MFSDSIAQTFTPVAPDELSGLFITQIDLFFATKRGNSGVEVFICETDTGLPKTNSILGSSYLRAANINVNSEVPIATTFKFKEPIYLNNLQEYAFIIKVDGNAAGFNLWCSELGGTDVTTNESVNTNPYMGTLFVSGNNNTWTANQEEDVKFTLYRANFTTNTAGDVFLFNKLEEYIKFDSLTKSAGKSIRVGDLVVRLNSSGNVVSNPNNQNFHRSTIKFVDEVNSIIRLNRSNGNLVTGENYAIFRPSTVEYDLNDTVALMDVNSNDLIATFELTETENPIYHAVVPKFSTFAPERTTFFLGFVGVDKNLQGDSSFERVTNNIETEFLDKERVLASRTNEISQRNGRKSSSFSGRFFSTSSYLSPVIDTRANSAIFVKNIINNDATDEHLRTGNAETKYLSKLVTLSTNIGNAEDMVAFAGVHRPNFTDIKVYIKIKNPDDSERFDDKLWTEMVNTSPNLFSEPGNRFDFKEFRFVLPEGLNNDLYEEDSEIGSTAYLENGIVRYKRSDDSILEGYNQFSFKIVLLSSNATFVPLLNDFRSIALQA